MRFRLRENISTNIRNTMHNILNYIFDFMDERMSLRSGSSLVSFYLYIQ